MSLRNAAPDAGRRLARRVASRLRARAYRGAPDELRRVPVPIRSRLRLDAPPPGGRRVEVGAGYLQRPGYIHVDISSAIPGIDFIARGDRLPLPAGWADEILAVHMIEHVPPPLLHKTLRHWWNVLVPGGVLNIHTPNGTALGRAIAEAPGSEGKAVWAAESAIYGYWLAPWEADGPERLSSIPDHKVLLTWPILADLLHDAGFTDVEDTTGQDPDCHHQRDWAPYVPGLCLEVRARKPIDAAP